MPKIYHITHIDNLAGIVDGFLWSDAERLRQALDCTLIGMSEIKRRRLEELEVGCHRGTRVGQYVPFYFCYRSIMLYLLHRGNHPDLSYSGGQRPILHLEADLAEVVEWAEREGLRWAFSNGNAAARYTRFHSSIDQLDNLGWGEIAATDWRDPITQERKQAEFLVEGCFPWDLVRRVGVIDNAIAESVKAAVAEAAHRPEVVVKRDWYY